jgi:serine phosphatase RsbU (regulator of sigma subunit)
LLALAGLSGAFGWLFAVLPLAASIATVGVGTMAIGGLDYLLFARGNLDIPPTAALLLPPLAWTAVEGYRRVATEREARIRERELQVARTIQRRLLPERPPQMPEFDVFGANDPAEAVGGDYYDWLPLGSDELAVVVGDVTGHGVPAALLMSHLRASFHAEARTGVAPRTIVGAVHASLVRAVESGRFATFFLAVLSRLGPTLRFCNAGHNPPLLVREGRMETLDATGLPLAMLEDASWTDEERQFRRGDVLVLYSDGIPECPWKQEMYGMERLESLVSGLAAGRSAKEIGEAVLADVRAFAHGHLHTDDVTLLVVRRV